MKRNIVAGFALVCCIGLSACATAPVDSSPAAITEVSLKGDQALYVAEAAYAGALTGIQAGVNLGLIKGDRAAKLLKLIETADQYRHTAEAASTMGDALTTQSNAALVISLAGQIQAALQAK